MIFHSNFDYLREQNAKFWNIKDLEHWVANIVIRQFEFVTISSFVSGNIQGVPRNMTVDK